MGLNQVNISSNEFETFATHSFVSLFNDKEFTDVTLVCDDSKQITAHKAILASSSPFFRAVLTQNAHPHPLLYLKGISLSQLQAILEFVYLGKTEICQDNIQEFFVTAKDLQIEGLTNNIRVDAVEKNSENSECMFEASLENITDIAPEENKPTEMGEDVLIKQENGSRSMRAMLVHINHLLLAISTDTKESSMMARDMPAQFVIFRLQEPTI